MLAGFFNSQCKSFNQIIISFWSLPFLQKFPVQPDLHPESQKPLRLLHPAQVSMHISEQLCPKYPLTQASKTLEYHVCIFQTFYLLISLKLYILLLMHTFIEHCRCYTDTYVFYTNLPDIQPHTQLNMYHLYGDIGLCQDIVHILQCSQYHKIHCDKLKHSLFFFIFHNDFWNKQE